MSTTYTIEFNGRASRERQGSSNVTTPNEEIILSNLNAKSNDIAQRIRDDLRRSLPPSVNVHVEINFSSGSIEWFGIIFILDWMSRLSGGASFIEYLSRSVSYIVNRIMRDEIRMLTPSPIYDTFNTETNILVQPGSVQDTSQTIQSSDGTIRRLVIFIVINTIILAIILLILIYTNFIA